MKNCPKCHKEWPEDYVYCPKDSTVLPVERWLLLVAGKTSWLDSDGQRRDRVTTSRHFSTNTDIANELFQRYGTDKFLLKVLELRNRSVEIELIPDAPHATTITPSVPAIAVESQQVREMNTTGNVTAQREKDALRN